MAGTISHFFDFRTFAKKPLKLLYLASPALQTARFVGVSANRAAVHYVRYGPLYHRSLPSSCGDGRPVYWLRTRMGRLLSAAPLDQRGASPRLASHLQTLAADFRAWPPASDPQRRLFRFHHRKHETRLAPRVAAGHRVRVRDRIRVHLAARAQAACCAARGEYPAFGSWARVCPRSRDPHTDPSAVSARARHPLFNDCQARPRHLAVHLARRHRGGPDLRRNGVDGTPCVAFLTRIRHPAVFSSDSRCVFSSSRMSGTGTSYARRANEFGKHFQ